MGAATPRSRSSFGVACAAVLVACAPSIGGCEGERPPPREAENAGRQDSGATPSNEGGTSGATSPQGGGGRAGHGPSFARIEPFGDVAQPLTNSLMQRIDAGRLYVVAGPALHVFDVSSPAVLRLLGTWPIPDDRYSGRLWMDAQDDVVIVLSRLAHTSFDAPGFWSSDIVLVDTKVSASDALLLDIAGAIIDALRVDDVLYVVSHPGSGEAGTVIASFDVSDPSAVPQLDVEIYGREISEWLLGTERLYAFDYRMDDAANLLRPFMQVIDISARSGIMQEAAALDVSGPLTSIDERGGTLRVVDNSAVLETFSIVSSDEITPLGQVDVRLDSTPLHVIYTETSAYATNQGESHAQLIDLSDPASPSNGGSVDVPGSFAALEPRGERLVTLEIGEGNDGLAVSLFDVSDLTQPSMLSQVAFAAGKSLGSSIGAPPVIPPKLTVLDELGLIIVEYSASSDENDELPSHVQLMDWDHGTDTLTLRGDISLELGAIALIHESHVFATDARSVASYDITDRDNPTLDDERAFPTMQ